ncbi:MAG: CocE/NonD family hydrolase C-terminal non-catalytic domain-containing protein, partial [Acidimicrobiales bacterium]
ALQPTASVGFSTWPPKGEVTRYFLGPDGSLTTAKAAKSTSASFRPNPAVRPATDLASSANAWAAQPPYDWTDVPAVNGIAFQSAPFKAMTTIIGPASLDLYLKSSAPVTDLQATVTEVRPGDREEEYVTSGFLDSADRTLGASSSELDPVPTYLGSQRRPLPRGRYTLVRIPIDPIGHVFRAGTRLRIVISAPGGDRPSWAFLTPNTADRVLDTVALGGVAGSSLVVNVVPGVAAPAAMPACGALRGEPCRPYRPLGNQS